MFFLPLISSPKQPTILVSVARGYLSFELFRNGRLRSVLLRASLHVGAPSGHVLWQAVPSHVRAAFPGRKILGYKLDTCVGALMGEVVQSF